MDCPCCQSEMLLAHEYTTEGIKDVLDRHYLTYICVKGRNYCAGLIAKHDLLDDKIDFITPCHTTTTLHVNYINSVSREDLLKTIFTTFEWCANEGY